MIFLACLCCKILQARPNTLKRGSNNGAFKAIKWLVWTILRDTQSTHAVSFSYTASTGQQQRIAFKHLANKRNFSSLLDSLSLSFFSFMLDAVVERVQWPTMLQRPSISLLGLCSIVNKLNYVELCRHFTVGQMEKLAKWVTCRESSKER